MTAFPLPVEVGVELVETIAARVAEIVVERLGDRTEWLRVEQAAEHLQTTPDGIRALVKRGKVPVHRRDGRLYFNRRELDGYVRGERE